MILSKSLKHGWYYYYKLHKETLDKLDDTAYDDLKTFLLDVRQKENRPDHRFDNGPRSSQVQLDISHDLTTEDHVISDLAAIGLESDFYKDKHMNVQMFLLAYDKETFAMEVPVWSDTIEKHLDGFETGSLTGHIDLLRFEDDHIFIWDYKPDAHRETHATTQTFLYALMLSERTGINLAQFRCGYFDKHNAYTFDPATSWSTLTS